MRLGVFGVSLRVIKPASIEKELCQGEMNPNQDIELVEKGCGSEGYLKMVNRLLDLALGLIYKAKGVLEIAEQGLFAIL